MDFDDMELMHISMFLQGVASEKYVSTDEVDRHNSIIRKIKNEMQRRLGRNS